MQNIFVMASPGQRRGSCGHVMAGFDLQKKCARCRDKKVGDDPCVKGQDCELCDKSSDSQKGMLATPQYQIRKDKKAGILISPSKVTVVGPVEDQDEIEMSPDAAHAQGRVVTGAFPVSDQTSTGDFVLRLSLPEPTYFQLPRCLFQQVKPLSLTRLLSIPLLTPEPPVR